MNETMNLTGIYQIPDEILQNIFLSLDPKSIMACRAVCWRWQQILDHPATSDKLWFMHCTKNYSDIYLSVYEKSVPGLRWSQIYKSLSLWSRLPLARDTIDDIKLPTSRKEYCIDGQVLRDGIIGVLTDNCILYYNMETLQLTQEFDLTDKNRYCNYKENKDSIVLRNRSDQLFIRRKDKTDAVVNTFDDVDIFMVLENVIYFVTNSNTLFKCIFVENSYTRTCLVQVPEKVLALGHENDTPSIFTISNNIYSYVNNALIKVPKYGKMYLWKTISKYNFSDNFALKNMFTFCLFYCLSGKYWDYKKIFNINQICIHGPILIIGYDNGIVRIFYSRHITSIVELLNSEPSKTYHLCKPNEDMSHNYIVYIDVVESDLSHMVVVAMRTKIVIIKITHPDNSEAPLYSNKEISTNSEVKSIETKKLSTSYEKPATGNRETLSPDGILRFQSQKESSSRGESSLARRSN